MSVYIAVLRNPAFVKKQAELEERLNQAGQDYLTGKRERITKLRGLGFKPNQIDTFLSYVPKNSKNSTTLGDAIGEINTLNGMLYESNLLKKENKLNKDGIEEYVKEYIEQCNAPLRKDGNPDKRFNNIFTKAENYTPESVSNIRRIIRKGGKLILLTAAGAGIILSGACKKNDIVNPPVTDEYNVIVDSFDLSNNNPMNWTIVADGNQHSSGESFYHKGNSIDLKVIGGHDAVLCVRKPGDQSNTYQVQDTDTVPVNLAALNQGNNIHLEVYKIGDDVNIEWVKEALSRGTAVYNKNVTVFLANEGYTSAKFKELKPLLISKINKHLDQINDAIDYKITADLDENASSGELKVRLAPSYTNPGHAESGSGIMDWSEIKAMADEESNNLLTELYQAMGVRHDIGVDGSLKDNITGSYTSDKLNDFGKRLMRINYFLNPNTKL